MSPTRKKNRKWNICDKHVEWCRKQCTCGEWGSRLWHSLWCGEAARDRDIRHNKMWEREGEEIRKELNFWANEWVRCVCLCTKNLTIYRQVCERVVHIPSHSHSYCVCVRSSNWKHCSLCTKWIEKRWKKWRKSLSSHGLANARSRFYCEHRKPTHKTCTHIYISSSAPHLARVCTRVTSVDKTWNKSKSTALGRIFHLTVTKSTKHLYSFKVNKFFVSSHIHVAAAAAATASAVEAAECWFSLTIHLTLSLSRSPSVSLHVRIVQLVVALENRSTYSTMYTLHKV